MYALVQSSSNELTVDPRFDDWRPAKRDWGPVVDPGCDGAVPQWHGMAESPWPLFSKQVRKAVALQQNSIPVTRPERTSSYSPGGNNLSSSGWRSGAGWKYEWHTGWYAGWQTGWKQ